MLIASNRVERTLYVALVVLQIACLIVTHSNGAIIAALLACALLMFWYWRRATWMTKVFIIGVLLFSMIATMLIAVQGDAIGDGLVKLTNYGREVRPFTWESGLNAVAARPLFGWGLSSFDLTHEQYASPGFRINLFPMPRVMDRVHNLWLESVETGLVVWVVVDDDVLGGSAVLGSRACEERETNDDLGLSCRMFWLRDLSGGEPE